jgi:hypothetical protein
MLKFSAFHEFLCAFFHLNYCAGCAYYLKKFKNSEKKENFFPFLNDVFEIINKVDRQAVIFI